LNSGLSVEVEQSLGVRLIDELHDADNSSRNWRPRLVRRCGSPRSALATIVILTPSRRA
jgi:hypothetical protein